jgi:hypothetical protein
LYVDDVSSAAVAHVIEEHEPLAPGPRRAQGRLEVCARAQERQAALVRLEAAGAVQQVARLGPIELRERCLDLCRRGVALSGRLERRPGFGGFGPPSSTRRPTPLGVSRARKTRVAANDVIVTRLKQSVSFATSGRNAGCVGLSRVAV